MPISLQSHFQRWINKRIPIQSELTLTQRKIFIIPSVQALYFFVVIFLLFVAAINYQNNLIYVLVFFLISLFNSAIIFTYSNLSQLHLRAGKTYPVFVDEFAQFDVELQTAPRKVHHQLHLHWPDNSEYVVDQVVDEPKTIKLHYLAKKRGYLKPGRLQIFSYYPLGLLRCWSWVDLGFTTIVFPKPIFSDEHHVNQNLGDKGKESIFLGQEDFYGFKAYSVGDHLYQINWRSLAKGQPLSTKVYAAQQSEDHWIDWYTIAEPSVERRLSIMCGCVITLHQLGVPYGLRMPNGDIVPSVGEAHKLQVLTCLALHEVNDAS